MILRFVALSLLSLLVVTAAAAGQEQRTFPTGGIGSSVKYLDAAGPGHPTACVVTVTAALPNLALSINLFSNNVASMVVAREMPFTPPKTGSDAGIAVGPDFLFGTVTGALIQGPFHVTKIDLIAGPYGSAMDGAFKAINRIVYGNTTVSVVADDVHIASSPVPQQPGLGDALIACQRYQVSKH